MILILSLQKHLNGIWMIKLIEKLQEQLLLLFHQHQLKQHDNHQSTTNDIIKIKAEAIDNIDDSTFWNNCNVNDLFGNDTNRIVGIINRVSDAADDKYVKRTIAILRAAIIMKIPVFNGPESYSLCTSKWCHHMLFQQANLHSPVTYLCTNNMTAVKSLINTIQEEEQQSNNQQQKNEKLNTKQYILKPNSGGFGNGIQFIDTSTTKFSIENENDNDIDTNHNNKIFGNDNDNEIHLLQEYIIPNKNKFYRVWFLNSKVQCAVERRTSTTSTNSSFNGCTSSITCSSSNNNNNNNNNSDNNNDINNDNTDVVIPWTIPLDVQNELEQQLLPLIPDANAGSIEFLIDPISNQRLYYDLNLLSTLPINNIDNTTTNTTTITNNAIKTVAVIGDIDPWTELAIHVLHVLRITIATQCTL